MPSSSSVVIALSIVITSVAADAAEECLVPADHDTLGLGVRLGLYFQISSVFILQLVRVDEGRSTFLVTAIFFTSFLIAVIFSAAQNQFPPGAVIACTWYPLLMFIGLAPVSLKGAHERQLASRWGIFLLLLVASSALNVWFWFKGITAYHPEQCMEPRVFFFANLSAYGGIRIVFRLLNLVLVIGIPSAFVYFVIRNILKQSKVKDVEIVGVPTVPSSQLLKDEISVSKASDHLLKGTPIPGAVTTEGPLSTRVVADMNLDSINVVSQTATAAKSTPMIRPVKSRNQISASWPATLTAARVPIEPTPQMLAKPPDAFSIIPPATTINNHPVEEAPATGEPKEAADNEIWTVSMGGFVWLAFYLTASELQLKWNHSAAINLVNTTGQIIPLAVGCLSLLRSIYLLRYADWPRLLKDEREEMEKPIAYRIGYRVGYKVGATGGMLYRKMFKSK